MRGSPPNVLAFTLRKGRGVLHFGSARVPPCAKKGLLKLERHCLQQSCNGLAWQTIVSFCKSSA